MQCAFRESSRRACFLASARAGSCEQAFVPSVHEMRSLSGRRGVWCLAAGRRWDDHLVSQLGAGLRTAGRGVPPRSSPTYRAALAGLDGRERPGVNTPAARFLRFKAGVGSETAGNAAHRPSPLYLRLAVPHNTKNDKMQQVLMGQWLGRSVCGGGGGGGVFA